MNRKREAVFMGIGILAGLALSGPASAAVQHLTATPSTQTFYVDGQQMWFEAYHIHGNNFVKLYYGNIAPHEQTMTPSSELRLAVDRVTHCEKQLEELLDEDGRTILTRFTRSQQEIDSITALENFILGFRLGVRIIAECMDTNDGDIKTGGD